MTHQFITAAQDAMPDIIELRRTLHRRPEVGNDLPQTRATVLAALEGLPLDIHLHAEPLMILERQIGATVRVPVVTGLLVEFGSSAVVLNKVEPDLVHHAEIVAGGREI